VTWALRIPYRHLDESLIDTASRCRELGQDDARVMRRIVISADTDGVAKSAGQLLDHLEALAPGERRALLDQARVAVGLPDTETTARRPVQGVRRVSVNEGLQASHADGCSAIPLTESRGWRPVNVRRWFCAGHEHLADPGDMDDLGSGIRYSEGGVLVPYDPGADARAASEAESRNAQLASAAADRQADAAAYAEHRAAQAEQLRAEPPSHLREAV
jgi:hypothetical protein